MAKPNRQHMLKMLKNSTRLLVDSAGRQKARVSLKRENKECSNRMYTIGVTHFLLQLAHVNKVLHDRVGQIFQTRQVNLERLQFGRFANLYTHNKQLINSRCCLRNKMSTRRDCSQNFMHGYHKQNTIGFFCDFSFRNRSKKSTHGQN